MQVDAAQAFFVVYLFKLVVLGAMVAVWFAWLTMKLAGNIDRNVALTVDEPTWTDYIRYRIDRRLRPEVDWEPVSRPRFRIGFFTYSVLMVFVMLVFATCW